MKVLYIATSDIHLATFHKPYIEWLIDNGIQVDIAIENRENLIIPGVSNTHYMNFPRSLFKKELLSSYKKLKCIIDKGNYSLIHCHTPIPSMLARIAGRESRKKGTKVLYTAHGFHFFKGAHFSRWMIYYPSEYILSYFTDGIITINQEDYKYISDKMLHKDSYYIKGIGVDSSRFKPFTNKEKEKKRSSLNIREEDFVLLYVAEFIPRKNHDFIIRSLELLVKKISNIKVLFAGRGILLEKMESLVKELNLSSNVNFLGFRNDINEICAIADIGISASKHEGLGLGLAEEMMCKVPIVASYDRGHKEMIIHGQTGYMYQQGNKNEFIKYIELLHKDTSLRKKMGEAAYQKAQEFEISHSLSSVSEIYKRYLKL